MLRHTNADSRSAPPGGRRTVATVPSRYATSGAALIAATCTAPEPGSGPASRSPNVLTGAIMKERRPKPTIRVRTPGKVVRKRVRPPRSSPSGRPRSVCQPWETT